MTRTSLLWRLQNIDHELDDKSKRARQIDDALAHDSVLAGARAEFETEQKTLTEQLGLLRAQEQQAASLDEKIKDIEKRLYSGLVMNPKELGGLEKDLEMHKRLRNQMDDKILTLMDSVDQAQIRLQVKTASLTQSEHIRSGEIERLEHERQGLAGRLVDLEAQREETRQSVDVDSLRHYDHLRKTKGGRPVVQVRSNSCAACGVEAPSGLIHRIRGGEEIVLCSGCGRILVE